MTHRPSARLVVALASAVCVLTACSDSTTPELGTCDVALQLFPTPVTSLTSLFPSVDDSFLFVPFSGFQFAFYGTSYDGVYLNTNGGMTFGAGNDDFDEAASSISEPGVAVFWGDMDASEYSGETRANQMGYRLCTDRVVVEYTAFQDNDEETWNNTATATLFADGTIVVEYGTVLSEDILVGIFDGAHDDDRYQAVQASYPGYASTGSGIILFDDWGPGPTHTGELSGRTVTYSPASPASYEVSLTPPGRRVRGEGAAAKGPKPGR